MNNAPGILVNSVNNLCSGSRLMKKDFNGKRKCHGHLIPSQKSEPNLSNPHSLALYAIELNDIYSTLPTASSMDHGFSTCLASSSSSFSFSSSSSSSFRHISFATYHEADMQSLTSMILGIVARDKVDVTYENWKKVSTTQKDLIWEDIQAEFEIPEVSNSRTKKEVTSDCRGEMEADGVDDTVCEKYGISKEKWAQFCQTRRDPSWEDVRKKAQAIQKQNTGPHVLSRGGYEYLEQKLLAEKTKKNVDGVIDPPSPVRRHVKRKMARTKKTGEMTTKAAKEIAEKIDSFKEQATQGSFVPRGRQDHPGRVRAVGANVTIKKYFGSAPQKSRSSSSLPPEELQQLTQQIRDQLEDSIIEKVTRQLMASFSQMQSQFQSQMQSQGLTLPPEPLVGPSVPRVSTKESCVDPSGNDAETGDSDRCDLYIEAIPAHLVALGRVYEGSTIVHNTPLFPGQVKVGVDEVKDPDALVPVPTDEVSLVGQAIHTFLAWPTHLVKSLSQQADVSLAKPPQKLDPEVDDPLYLMTLTIPELFLRPYQVTWDATVFGIFNPDFPLYIKHEDLSKIAHGGQCLSISVLQLWIFMRAGNSYLYGFLEPQSIQRFRQSQFEIESYIKSWMQSSKHDVYLGAYLNGEHWQMVVIAPKEHLVVWFCSLHNRPDNYLKGIINSALKGLDDAPQPKSKAPARWIVIKNPNRAIRGGALESTRDATIANREHLSDYLENPNRAIRGGALESTRDVTIANREHLSDYLELEDESLVAVKVLKELKGNGEEFINEVASISRTSHVNIVTLIGFCFEKSKKALVYEFMANGSLEKFIFETNNLTGDYQLNCEMLYQIAVGVGRGLEYLHRGCSTRIFHFDIKPHNILLDENFFPKISDFGLAKICPRNESVPHNILLDENFFPKISDFGLAKICPRNESVVNIGVVSHKSDVYSYGMMVLEMVGGRKNINVEVDCTNEIYFPYWIYKRLELNQELALRNVINESDRDIIKKMVLVSLWCIQTDPSDRPTMHRVVEMLEGNVEGNVETIQVPPKPFLSSPSISPRTSPSH
ncbi:PR5-like receptor kinase [Glycine soja]